MIVQTNFRPGTSLRILCDVAKEYGITTEACLQNTDITYQDLATGTTQFSTHQEIQAIENLVQLLPDAVGLGVDVGKKMHVNAFGIWGFAILTSPTLRSAIQTSIEYMQLSFVIAEMRLDVEQDKAILQFDMTGLPAAIHQFILERHAFVAMTFIKELIQQPDCPFFEIETRCNDATYLGDLSDSMDATMLGGRDRHALIFPVSILDAPLPKSDAVSLGYCLEQCKELLKQLHGTLPEWSQKVRDQIVDVIGAEQRIEDVAAKLAVTERTLRRRLTREGTSFRDIYTDARLSLAYELLETAGLNVETVAWRVGYSEPASFVRAFSKKFGKTPGEIRKEALKNS